MGRKAKKRQVRKRFQLINESLSNESDLSALGPEIVQISCFPMPGSYQGTISDVSARNFSTENLVRESPAEDNMSEIMLAFVEPFVEVFKQKDEEIWKKLINLAMVAWHSSLMKPNLRKEMMGEALDEIFIGEDREGRDGIFKLMELMLKIKKENFAEYRQTILDYHIKYEEDKFNLYVISVKMD